MPRAISIETFVDWVKLLGEDAQTGVEWQNQNFEPWCLLWMEFAHGPGEALERYKIISNSPNRGELLNDEYKQFLDLIPIARRVLLDEKKPGESGSKPAKNPPAAGFGAGGDPPGGEGRPESGGNGAGGEALAGV